MREPKPEKKAPVKPHQLDALAKRIWIRVVKQLEPLGLIAVTDDALLSAYCQTYSTWLTMCGELKRDGAFVNLPVIVNGEVVLDANGNTLTEPVKNPRLVEMRLLATQLRYMAAEFGMTPTARARLEVPEKEEDEMKAWEAAAKEHSKKRVTG